MVLKRGFETACVFLLITNCVASCASPPPLPPHAFAFAGAASDEADYVDVATIQPAGEGDRLVWLLKVYGGGGPTSYSLLEHDISCRYRQLSLRYGADFSRDGALLNEGGGDGTITPIVPGTISDQVFAYVCGGYDIFPASAFLSDPNEAVRSGEAIIAETARTPPKKAAPSP